MYIYKYICIYDEKISVIENWLHPKYISFHF